MRKRLMLCAIASLVAGALINGQAVARDRSDRAELTTGQIADQAAARAAQMKADLHLTEAQEKNWSGFETAVLDMWKKQPAREIAWRSAHANQQGSVDLIDDMRKDADDQIERYTDRKKLADAAKPLYASLDDGQKRRFAAALFRQERDRRSY